MRACCLLHGFRGCYTLLRNNSSQAPCLHEVEDHIFNMAQTLGDFAKRFGSGAPRGVGLGLKLLIGAGAIGYGIKESIYTGKFGYSFFHDYSE